MLWSRSAAGCFLYDSGWFASTHDSETKSHKLREGGFVLEKIRLPQGKNGCSVALVVYLVSFTLRDFLL